MILPVAVVAAVLMGLLAGFLVWGTDDTESAAQVVAGDAELTPRQEQMVELVDDYVAAWQTGDGAAAAAMFTENGELIIFGAEVSDIEAGLSRSPQSTLDVLEPVLVRENEMLMFHTVLGYGTLVDVIEFTATGELLMISHEIMR